LSGDAIETTLDRVRNSISKMDGTLLKIDHLGRKKFAYPIQKQTRGIYVQTHYVGKDKLVSEVERNLRISDSVLRYLTVRIAASITTDDHEVVEYVRPEYDAQMDEANGDEQFEGREGREGREASEAPRAAAKTADVAEAVEAVEATATEAVEEVAAEDAPQAKDVVSEDTAAEETEA
jgi:small subunit ribosomal protein S6